jgi:hypothetical protein
MKDSPLKLALSLLPVEVHDHDDRIDCVRIVFAMRVLASAWNGSCAGIYPNVEG